MGYTVISVRLNSFLGCFPQCHDIQLLRCRNDSTGGIFDFSKADVYDYIKQGFYFRVGTGTWPYLDACLRGNEKYARSEPNDSFSDNLLSLPRF